MGLLTALPTQAGIAILNSELRQEVQLFVLIGHAEHEFETLDTLLAGDLMELTHAQIQPYIFFTRAVERTYFDDEGVLTFSLLIPHEDDLGKTIYALGLITEAEEGESPTLVSLSKTPKIPKVANVGGHFTYKVAVRGQAAQVVFRNRNLVTSVELAETRESLEEAIQNVQTATQTYSNTQFTALQNSRASTTVHGLVRLATDAETREATDTQTAVAPAGLAGIIAHLANTGIHFGGFRFRRFDSSSTYRPADEVKSMIVFVAGAGGHGGNDDYDNPIAPGGQSTFRNADRSLNIVAEGGSGGMGGRRSPIIDTNRRASHGDASGGDLHFYGRGGIGGSGTIQTLHLSTHGADGGSGGLAIKYITHPESSYTVIVGAGSNSYNAGSAGHNGWVIILEVL